MTFSDYVRILRQFLWLVVGATVVGAVVALVALSLPPRSTRRSSPVALAPNTIDPACYGNLVDAARPAVDPEHARRRSSNSPIVKETAATGIGRVPSEDWAMTPSS